MNNPYQMEQMYSESFKKDNAYFDALVSNLGVPSFRFSDAALDLTLLRPTLIRLRVEISGMAQRYAMDRTPIIGLIDDFSFNAFATITRDQNVIGINLGAIFVLSNFFAVLTGSPSPKESYFSKSGLVQDFMERRKILSITTEVQSQALFSQLFHNACSWLAYHEFAHIKNGHIALIQGSPPVSRVLQEVHTGSLQTGSLLDLQTFEMDADQSASTHIVTGYIQKNNILSSS